MYEAMHQTEKALSFDHKYPGTTNQDHSSAYVNLVRMMLAIPHLNDRGEYGGYRIVSTLLNYRPELYLKPVVAHCRMVLCPEDYVHRKPPEPVKYRTRAGKGKPPLDDDPEDVRNAKVIAEHILEYLNLSLESLDNVLYGSSNHNDPGDRVDLEGLWREKVHLLTRDA